MIEYIVTIDDSFRKIIGDEFVNQIKDELLSKFSDKPNTFYE